MENENEIKEILKVEIENAEIGKKRMSIKNRLLKRAFDRVDPAIKEKIYEKAMSGMSIGEIKETLKAEMDVRKLALGVVVAVVVIVIAVSLLPAIYSATSGALTSNITSNSHYTSSVSLAYLIPLIFVAGILVIILYMMFGGRSE